MTQAEGGAPAAEAAEKRGEAVCKGGEAEAAAKAAGAADADVEERGEGAGAA
jgi:hypothetical protein